MPKISKKTKQKIQEQILHYLFVISPESRFTNQIAEEIARDEEFVKSLLLDLKTKSLVLELNKNPKGIKYQRRQRWCISPKAYLVYKQKQ